MSASDEAANYHAGQRLAILGEQLMADAVRAGYIRPSLPAESHVCQHPNRKLVCQDCREVLHWESTFLVGKAPAQAEEARPLRYAPPPIMSAGEWTYWKSKITELTGKMDELLRCQADPLEAKEPALGAGE